MSCCPSTRAKTAGDDSPDTACRRHVMFQSRVSAAVGAYGPERAPALLGLLTFARIWKTAPAFLLIVTALSKLNGNNTAATGRSIWPALSPGARRFVVFGDEEHSYISSARLLRDAETSQKRRRCRRPSAQQPKSKSLFIARLVPLHGIASRHTAKDIVRHTEQH
jgi:hypothetical protein